MPAKSLFEGGRAEGWLPSTQAHAPRNLHLERAISAIVVSEFRGLKFNLSESSLKTMGGDSISCIVRSRVINGTIVWHFASNFRYKKIIVWWAMITSKFDLVFFFQNSFLLFKNTFRIYAYLPCLTVDTESFKNLLSIIFFLLKSLVKRETELW